MSDQYASQIVMANGKTYTGIVAKQPDGSMTVLQSDGGKATLAADDIEEIEPSKASAMPEGLLESAHAGAGGRLVRVPDGRLERDDGGPGDGAAAVG